MSKKKKRGFRRRKPEKPLLTLTGVLHLQKSFVPPTQESGLLNTVGDQETQVQALVLAPNYGYGIPASVVSQKETEREQEEMEATPSNVVEVNGVQTITTDKNMIELNEDFPMTDDKPKQSNPESLTIAELVRSIGGAADKPFMRSDVVEDVKPPPELVDIESDEDDIENDPNNKRTHMLLDEEGNEIIDADGNSTLAVESNVNPEEENDFYESLGISRPKPQPPSNQNEQQEQDEQQQQEQEVQLQYQYQYQKQSTPVKELPKDNNYASTSYISTSNQYVVDADELLFKKPSLLSATTYLSEEGKENETSETTTTNTTTNYTDSIADYYKTYCHYYFASDVVDPYSDQPLEFGKTIANDENKEEPPNEEDQSIIDLARMAQRARRAMEAAAMASKIVYGPKLPTAEEEEAALYDPLPMEIVPSATCEAPANDTTMEQYWDYVKESPRDFNRWSYLIQHAENSKNVAECRKAYSAFLPLFPYCFGYWKRYSDMEKSFSYFQRALAILQRGLEFNPLSVEMWLAYLQSFNELHGRDKNFQTIMREQYERALNCAGMEFRSDGLWDAFIDWELNQKRLRNVFALYRRLLKVPTRLYNRHWDNFKALVRDHHPRDFLEKAEYEQFRKKGCKILKFKYKEEPEIEPGEIIKTSKPEDKLMAHVKEKIIVRLEKTHKLTLAEADKRWDYEDRIKRPYFHTKPLDKTQLRNWEDYLNYEISEGNHDRIVLLFERCLIACAMYETFWCKYARYLEKYHRKVSNAEQQISKHFQKSQINLIEIDQSKKEIAEEEVRVSAITQLLSDMIGAIEKEEEVEKDTIQQVMTSIVDLVCASEQQQQNSDQQTENQCSNNNNNNYNNNNSDNNNINNGQMDENIKLLINNNVSEGVGKTDSSVALSSNSIKESLPNTVEHAKNDYDDTVSSFSSLLSVPVFPPSRYYWHEVVRDVYKRACIVHCPNKPIIRLQWAAFEEEIENVKGAKELISHVISWYPKLLDAKSQLIELERRTGNKDEVVRLFESYLKTANSNPSEYSTLAIKYARFLYKELGKPDKALAVLRKAVKKDKGNHLLYNYVFDICHERFPSDKKGASAALELALQSKDVTNEYKLLFSKKKVLFLQEHGDLRKYRDAIDQLSELQEIVRKERAAEEASRPPEPQHYIPVPQLPMPVSAFDDSYDDYIPIHFEPVDDHRTAEDHRTSTRSNETEKEVYKSVPPTAELLNDNYGYGNHPDAKLQEHLSHQEYDKLIAQGYPDELKDPEPTANVKTMNPGGRKRKSDIPMFIIPPRGEFLVNYLKKKKVQNSYR